MIIESSYITLREVRFHAFHGVMPQERKVGADFTVTLRVKADLSRPVFSDNVNDTLNYAALYDVLKREMAQPSRLLEHVAGRIGQAVFDSFPQVETADVTLTKLNPPMGADSEGAAVELHLINNKTQE
ncbi:MAG: dihydroneopterin aldolase [Prevotella sp.]|nr:dihydroneopterin aldolase [Prevotella sp.]